MSTLRTLLSSKLASGATKVVVLGLTLVAVSGTIAACSAGDNAASSADEVNANGRGARLPYTMKNYKK